MKALLLVLAVAASVGISSAQTNLIPCATEYYARICNVDDADGVADWITDQLDAVTQCNLPETEQFAEGIASICARDTPSGIYCGAAQFYLPEVLRFLTTDCADTVANESANCSLACATSLQDIRARLGCCINVVFNLTGPDQFAQIELAFSYSLWSRCDVATVDYACTGPELLYEISETTCTPLEQRNRVAAAFCTAEEDELRNNLAAERADCADFDEYLDNYCTSDETGRYCLTRDGPADTENYLDPIRQNCQSDESCSADCKQSLDEFHTALGCCLNPVYNSTARILGLDNFPLADDSLFRLCELDIPTATCGSQVSIEFINNSPLLTDNGTVTVYFSQPDVANPRYRCRIRRRSQPREKLRFTCSDGSFTTSLIPGVYIVFVVFRDLDTGEKLVIRRKLTVPELNDCAANLINEGVGVVEGDVMIEWSSTGAPSGFQCRLDQQQQFNCTSPLTLSSLTSGKHRFRITTQGCALGDDQQTKFRFTIP